MEIKTNLQCKQWQRVWVCFAAVLMAGVALFSSNSYAVKTYVLGNYSRETQTGSGPTGDGNDTIYYSSKPTLIFSRTSKLAPANVKLTWDDFHGSASKNTSSLYCTQLNTGTGNGISVESSYISAGSYNGVEIFKTNITGLYFSLNLRAFSTDNEATANISSLDITSGIIHQAIKLTPLSDFCDATNTTGTANYATGGGLGFYATFTFYTDQNYTSGTSSIVLLKTADYDLRMWNENPGSGIKSYYKNTIYDISSIVVSEPTCSTQPVASGSSVSGTTVNLGSYSPNDIINGATPVPFAINLAGCKGLRNINVTLTTTTSASDPTLLGNILTSNHATGVGLEIRGAANNYSAEMVMIPNETTSVYNDQRDTSSDNNIYGSDERGTVQSQTLNFLATLKRDSNQKIGSGNFKANGIFTFDYP